MNLNWILQNERYAFLRHFFYSFLTNHSFVKCEDKETRYLDSIPEQANIQYIYTTISFAGAITIYIKSGSCVAHLQMPIDGEMSSTKPKCFGVENK